MAQWNHPLEIDFPQLFTSVDREGFPVLGDGEEGIRIFADNLNFEEDVFSCQLLVSFAFSRQFCCRFKRLAQAITILIENADTGQYHHMSLIDPHKIYPSLDGDNFNPSDQNRLTGIKTSYREIPISMAISNPDWGPHLFMRAVLQDITSNLLAFNFSNELEMSSYMNDQPFSVQLSSNDDE